MADSAGAIGTALRAIFPGIQVATCYFHLRQAIKKHQHMFRKSDNFSEFMTDTQKLASLPSEEQFAAGLGLLEEKYKRKEPEVVDWFFQYWGSERCRNWFAAFTAPGLPNTNNSLESRNKLLKLFVTNHERFSIGVYMQKLRKELKSLSLEATRNEFPLTPENSRKIWVAAQHWLIEIKVPFHKSRCILSGKSGKHFVPASSNLKTTNSSKELFERLRQFHKSALPLAGEVFDEYFLRVASFYVLEGIEPNGHTHFSCTCTNYQKYASCKHALGASIHFGKVAVPDVWNSTKLTDKSKAGRPKLVKNCLEKNS
jgi:hypothetical protein